MSQKSSTKSKRTDGPAKKSTRSQKRVTLRDIAETIGVSSMTVSLALRNHPRISDSMRERIQEAARKMNYAPDPMLHALAHYRLGSSEKPIQTALAWLNSWADPLALRRYHVFDGYWRGAVEAAETLGYHLEEYVVDSGMSAKRLADILYARSVRGILIPPGPLLQDWKKFPWKDFSLVRMGRTDRKDWLPAHTVMTDQAENAMLAFDEVLKKGYQRIGYVGIHWRQRHLGAGFLWAQMDLPREKRLPLLFIGDERDEERQIALETWLKKHQPDAIITEIPELPGMLKRAGVRVPNDVGLACMEVLDCPIEAGITQNPTEVGRVAVQTLASLIHINDLGIPQFSRQILVEGYWVDGPSLPPMKRRRARSLSKQGAPS